MGTAATLPFRPLNISANRIHTPRHRLNFFARLRSVWGEFARLEAARDQSSCLVSFLCTNPPTQQYHFDVSERVRVSGWVWTVIIFEQYSCAWVGNGRRVFADVNGTIRLAGRLSNG